MAKNKMNKILEKLESNELMLPVAFGIAIVFMGFTFVPVQYNVIGKSGISLIFLSLGTFVILFSIRKISENPWFVLIRHILYAVFGICFGMGAVFLIIFVISKLSKLLALLSVLFLAI